MTHQTSIILCVNRRLSDAQPSCAARGSEHLKTLLEQDILRKGLEAHVDEVHCLGMCERGPNLRIAPGGPFFHGVNEENYAQVIAALENFIRAR